MKYNSVHTTIEKKLKNMDIYLPLDYLKITKCVRIKPFSYDVKLCDFSFFKQYQTNIQRYESIRSGTETGNLITVTDIRALRYNIDGTIEFKTNFDEDYCDLKLVQNRRKKRLIYLHP